MDILVTNRSNKLWTKPGYMSTDSFTLFMARDGCKDSIKRIKEIDEYNKKILLNENNMTYQKTLEEGLKEFDKLTPDSGDLDLDYDGAKKWLEENHHLFTGEMYDEPAFTLDKDKIKSFLTTFADKLHKATIEEVGEGVARLLETSHYNKDQTYNIGVKESLSIIRSQL